MIQIALAFLFSFGFQQQQDPIPTATPPADVRGIADDASQVQSTVEAFRNEPPISTDGEQIFDENGQALLPDVTGPNLTAALGYTKWVLDINNTRRVFGPFSIIVNHMRVFFSLVLAWFAFYGAWRLIRIAIKFALFLLKYQQALLFFAIVSGAVAILYSIYELINALSGGIVQDRLAWIPLAIEVISIQLRG